MELLIKTNLYLKKMKELEITFKGRGTVKGFMFTQIKKTDNGYIYEVNDENRIHYEVFKRKVNNKYNCISYPRDKSFGIWAWTYKRLEDAMYKLEEMEVVNGNI